MPRKSKPGVFCLESDWSSDLRDKLSAKPVLDLLEHAGCIRRDSIYHKVHTPDALCQRMQQWTQKQYSGYSLGYLALHGREGCIGVGRKHIHLAELGEGLRNRCAGKTIYFGSCSTFNIAKADIAEFRRVTRAKCVAGYTTDVEWIEAAAFELLLFDCLGYYRRSDTVERWLKGYHGALVRRLGFKMHYG